MGGLGNHRMSIGWGHTGAVPGQKEFKELLNQSTERGFYTNNILSPYRTWFGNFLLHMAYLLFEDPLALQLADTLINLCFCSHK